MGCLFWSDFEPDMLDAIRKESQVQQQAEETDESQLTNRRNLT
jgi:hypothetical protein